MGQQLESQPKSIQDAIADYLDKSVEKLDRMFLLICRTRASYIRARNYHREDDFTNCHNTRLYANTQLKILAKIIDKNFKEHE